ncbi:putative phage terminase (plasmid) [Carbonactinospora thermoautotrophica]|uniref:Putative phage terminase n=1 Tax=Carbonactinospora thermoautotrophica TaxID=1469144 RepID=A0A132MHP7_9ACTN|nr:terminase family protein [Carbonactinospora thermoautotrophica]KWW97366.1 putative phage terminase [Carbonactinospora thermoautotrophica]
MPTPRQRRAHALVADEMLYGGAAGGGKSDMLLAAAVTFCLLVPGGTAIIFRRTFPELSRSLVPRLLARIPKDVARYNSTEHVWYFRNGSRLELGHLQRDADVLKYQSAEYQLICFDELTQFTEFQYKYLLSRLRAGGEVRDRLAQLGLRPRVISAANPGGPGHHWVKARFIDPAPPEVIWKPPATLDDPRPGTRVFIPAKVTDNPHIDDSYVDRLNRLDDTLRRALRDGDWDILEGAMFAGWRRHIHVIDPEQFPVPISAGIPRAVGVDYGLDAPFCALWGARFGDGLVVVYRELYAAGLTARQQAEAIRDAELPGERSPGRPIPVMLDPSCWARGPHTAGSKVRPVDPDAPPPGSIAHAYRDVLGNAVHRANNDRLAGVQLVADKLRVRDDDLPRLLVYSTCVNLIRTLPTLPRSPSNPEDVDTAAEDHAYDALRYLLMRLEGGRSYPHRPPQEDTAARHLLRAETADLARTGF